MPITVTWLGQAGFILESEAGTRLAIDAFLSGSEDRLRPPPQLAELGRLDLLLATHEHMDHLDLPVLGALRGRYPHLEVVVPAALPPLVREAGADRVTGLAAGDQIRRGDVTISAVPAIHAVEIEDGYAVTAPGSEGRWAGYVVAFDRGPVLWHSGDSLVSAELIDQVRPHGVTVALLPVNGRDYFRESRGVVGNCDAREAVQAVQRLGASTLVPMHHDLIRGNTAAAGAAADAVRELGAPVNVLSLAPLVPYVLAA
ncbi:MAG: MBL fold metallo-hydrolase [Actinobacteria bacterium]|nr:MBL fold metallo-hydrolase [Actinomycetota bacterium]MBO0786423.1 MBL fold metallo-hydrolase [Actinomycetota bacterium]MBO0817491.1 MBL fold metallo-hydrolase [Actinomycetota bacterium]